MTNVLLAFLIGMILASPREARPPSPPPGIGFAVACEIIILLWAIGLFAMFATVGR